MSKDGFVHAGDSQVAEIGAAIHQSPNNSYQDKPQTNQVTSNSLLLNHYGEVDIEPEPIEVCETNLTLPGYNPPIHYHGDENEVAPMDRSPQPVRGAPQAYSPIALHSQNSIGTNNPGIISTAINAETMPAPTPLDHLMYSLPSDINLSADVNPEDLNGSIADKIDFSIHANSLQQTIRTTPNNEVKMQHQFRSIPKPPPPPDLDIIVPPITTSLDKTPLIEAPSAMNIVRTSASSKKQSYLTAPQAIQLVQLQEKKKARKNKLPKRKLAYSMYSSDKYHHFHHVQREAQQEQEEKNTYALPTAAQITAAIPSDASSIFHIFDRRVDFDALPGNASNYSLLRRWVQDDPYRKESGRLPNLMDHIILPSQQRKRIYNGAPLNSGHSNEIGHYEGREAKDDCDVEKSLDLLDSTVINSSSMMDVKKYLESCISKGAKKRKEKTTALKRRDQAILKRLESTLGIKVKDSK